MAVWEYHDVLPGKDTTTGVHARSRTARVLPGLDGYYLSSPTESGDPRQRLHTHHGFYAYGDVGEGTKNIESGGVCAPLLAWSRCFQRRATYHSARRLAVLPRCRRAYCPLGRARATAVQAEGAAWRTDSRLRRTDGRVKAHLSFYSSHGGTAANDALVGVLLDSLATSMFRWAPLLWAYTGAGKQAQLLALKTSMAKNWACCYRLPTALGLCSGRRNARYCWALFIRNRRGAVHTYSCRDS